MNFLPRVSIIFLLLLIGIISWKVQASEIALQPLPVSPDGSTYVHNILGAYEKLRERLATVPDKTKIDAICEQLSELKHDITPEQKESIFEELNHYQLEAGRLAI